MDSLLLRTLYHSLLFGGGKGNGGGLNLPPCFFLPVGDAISVFFGAFIREISGDFPHP